METLFLIGRILFGGFFLMMGANHFMKMTSMVSYAKSKSIPVPALAVGVSGLMLLAGGLGVILGYQVVNALWLIIVFLLIVSFSMHRFWKETDGGAKMMEMVNFTKNMALLGAALMMLMLPLPWVMSL